MFNPTKFDLGGVTWMQLEQARDATPCAAASEVAEEQRNLARDKLDSFLRAEVPLGESPRILLSGDAATQITQLRRTKRFDLIVYA